MRRPRGHLLGLLALAVSGCASGAAAGPSTSESTPAPTATIASTSTTSTSTITPTTPLTPTTLTTTLTTTTPTTASATLGPPSIAIWPTPAKPVALPRPSGGDGVGVAATGFADTVVYYPARAGTGRGHARYLDPKWAFAAGLDPAAMDRVVPNAEIDATPIPGTSPRPVLILNPGWRSVIAFSTSLAEDLASHGYVVLASQTDIATESGHSKTTAEDRATRVALLHHLLDFATGPVLPSLVGPVDVRRIAAGGHSYGGSIALDVALTDARIAAVVDIDGGARAPAGRQPPRQTTLVVVTMDAGVVSDPTLSQLVVRSPHIVSVGVDNALHADVTDAAVMPQLLGTSVYATLIGKVGPTGNADATAIVRRFLDAAIAKAPHLPTSAELVRGLPSTNDDPFAGVT